MEPKTYIDIAEKNITPVVEEVGVMLGLSSTYIQVGLIALSVIASYTVAKLLRHFITTVKEPDRRVKAYSKRWFARRSGRMIFPIFLILALYVSGFVAEFFKSEADIIAASIKVGIVFLLWVFIRAFVTSTLIRTVAIWILLPAVMLNLFGMYSSAADHLNDYGFTLGKIEITAYTFFKAIFFVSIIMWLGSVLSNAGEGYIRGRNTLTRSSQELLAKLFNIFLFVVLSVVTLNLIGIDLTTLAVFGGALGVGLGFGLQKIASNFISGLILLTERSINVNNLVEMDDGIYGYVRKLGSRATVIETFDGKEVMVPNEDFITSRVANLTHSSTSGRIEIDVGVSYDTDLHLAHDLILAAAKNYSSALMNDKAKEPKCFLKEYGDSSVNFVLTFWLEDVTTGRWRAKSDVMFAIWDSFKENNIEIPFPQRDLNIGSGWDQVANSLNKNKG